jgi:branched-chain amino acid aminotransferase
MSNAFPATEWIWADGEIVRWQDATLHVMSHVVHYGSSVFEGMRAYATKQGRMYFRYAEHMQRLRESAAIYRMEYPWTDDQLRSATSELMERNGLEGSYVRPIVLRGLGAAGIDPVSSPVHVFVVVWNWGAYLGPEALEKGVDAGVSSWFRPAPNTHPSMAKAGGNYLNSSLMKMEAKRNGYDEAIALSVDGLVSEGSGQNLFLVRDGVLYTPPLSASVLPGITRDSVITLAQDQGLTVREQDLPREMLYVCDEVFFAGTAAEITPIRSVDKIQIGAGRRGPITSALQTAFFDYINGVVPDRHDWLTPVQIPKATPVAAAARG